MGKSYVNNLFKQYFVYREPIKISWRELPGNKLQAWVDPATAVPPRGTLWGLREEDMDPIQEWCERNNCGKRMSFDTWHFRSAKYKTMFLLRWAQ
jgi:hypothetical protein